MDISFGEIGLSATFFNPESGKAMLPRRRTRARLLVLAVFKKNLLPFSATRFSYLSPQTRDGISARGRGGEICRDECL